MYWPQLWKVVLHQSCSWSTPMSCSPLWCSKSEFVYVGSGTISLYYLHVTILQNIMLCPTLRHVLNNTLSLFLYAELCSKYEEKYNYKFLDYLLFCDIQFELMHRISFHSWSCPAFQQEDTLLTNKTWRLWELSWTILIQWH